jgi:hypothetical protein
MHCIICSSVPTTLGRREVVVSDRSLQYKELQRTSHPRLAFASSYQQRRLAVHPHLYSDQQIYIIYLRSKTKQAKNKTPYPLQTRNFVHSHDKIS